MSCFFLLYFVVVVAGVVVVGVARASAPGINGEKWKIKTLFVCREYVLCICYSSTNILNNLNK